MGTLSYPSEIRGMAGGYTQSITRVGSICGAYTFPIVTASHGIQVTIAVIVLAPLTAIVALNVIRWEPIGCDLDRPLAGQSQQSFAG